ncbi:MAG: hypothetical protein HGA87_04895 [Desulfobulbaceae bacterium]|nr:hypothetical protein [Desulfobulbaceae bacterium]
MQNKRTISASVQNNYLFPARYLLSGNDSRHLFAAGLLLLCAIDEISQEEHKKSKSDHNLFEKTWIRLFPIPARSKCIADDHYELFPEGKGKEAVGKIIWYIFRSCVAHNGGNIKDLNALKNLGAWTENYDRFVFVNRSDREEVPVFCLNPPDKDKKRKITLDVGKILNKLEALSDESK